LIIGLFLAIYSYLIPSAIHLFHDKLYIYLCILWIPSLGIPVFILFGMRYIISGDRLYFKMWCIPNGSIKISDILLVERSYNPLSSPAASLKRLCIRMEEGAKYPYWLISPVREQEFIKELKSIDPLIHVHVPVKKGIWRFWDWDI
jgi:hypothetical protein